MKIVSELSVVPRIVVELTEAEAVALHHIASYEAKAVLAHLGSYGLTVNDLEPALRSARAGFGVALDELKRAREALRQVRAKSTPTPTDDA